MQKNTFVLAIGYSNKKIGDKWTQISLLSESKQLIFSAIHRAARSRRQSQSNEFVALHSTKKKLRALKSGVHFSCTSRAQTHLGFQRRRNSAALPSGTAHNRSRAAQWKRHCYTFLYHFEPPRGKHNSCSGTCRWNIAAWYRNS
jgi:hypothetical protein